MGEAAGLQLARFERDLADPEMRTCVAQEHHRAVAREVADTPTCAFADGHHAALRVRGLPHGEAEAVELFGAFRQLIVRFPYLEAVRRSPPPRN